METQKCYPFYIDKIKRTPSFVMNNDHFHSYYELYYMLTGTCRYFVNDTVYQLKQGDIMLISKDDLHHTSYYFKGTHERIVIYFRENTTEPSETKSIKDSLKSDKYTIVNNRRAEVEELLLKMQVEIKLTDDYSRQLLYYYFQQLMLLIMRYRDYSTDNPEAVSTSDYAIQAAAKFIFKNFANDITLNDAAEVADLSPTYFSKKFKQVTGFSFKEYLNQIRLKEASVQLLETKSSITEIAFRCGFNNSNYFGDLFKKAKGVSPAQYRKG